MTEDKKLNLSAMVKKDIDHTSLQAEKSSVIPNTDDVKIDQKPGIKINLSSIKTDKKPELKVEKQEVQTDKKTAIKTPSQERFDSLTSRVNTNEKEEIKTISQERKLKISALKSPIKKQNNEEKSEKKAISEKKDTLDRLKNPLENKDTWEVNNVQQESISDNTKIKVENVQQEKIKEESPEKKLSENEKKDVYEDENAEVFTNYESDFKKKESKVLEWIQKLKEIANIKKMSKTNKIFVFSIIGLTVIGVSFLVYLEPNKHTLENYKASILTLAGKQMTQEEINTHQDNIQKEIDWKLEENNLWGYDLWFEILVNDMWEAVYKFDGIEYKSKQELDTAIQEKLEVLKKDKIREYFKKENNSIQENIPEV